MDERDDIPDPKEDDLWDPDLHRRTVLEMSMDERGELMVQVMRQADLLSTAVRVP